MIKPSVSHSIDYSTRGSTVVHSRFMVIKSAPQNQRSLDMAQYSLLSIIQFATIEEFDYASDVGF
jgi:hypothetical protein